MSQAKKNEKIKSNKIEVWTFPAGQTFIELKETMTNPGEDSGIHKVLISN